MIATIMSAQRRETRGKWLVGALIVIGLLAAIAGLKFRVLSPRPASPPMSSPATP
jgi:hypothetical protein